MNSYTGTPVRRNVATTVDLIGQLLALYRLPGESLSSFKERILDVCINPAGVPYERLYSGIARELGEDAHTRGLLIDTARDADGLPLDTLVGLEVSARYLRLFSEHETETELAAFDLWDRGTAYFVYQLVQQIVNTPGWDAIAIGLDDYTKSYNLQHVTSRKAIRNHILRGSRVNSLSELLVMEPIDGSG